MSFPIAIMLWGRLIFGYNFVTLQDSKARTCVHNSPLKTQSTHRLWRHSATRSSFLVSFENQSAKCQVNCFSEPNNHRFHTLNIKAKNLGKIRVFLSGFFKGLKLDSIRIKIRFLLYPNYFP